MKGNPSKLTLVILCGVLVTFVAIYQLGSKKFRKNLEPKEYINWVNDEENGLIKNNTIENYNYRCQYLPIDYFLARYNNIKYLENQKSNIQNTISLVFEFMAKKVDDAILSPNIIGQEMYLERLHYLNTEAKKDFKLIIQNDTLKCMDLNYENPFGISKNLKIMLDFDFQNVTTFDDFTLIYEDCNPPQK
jgi:hypothetical protein